MRTTWHRAVITLVSLGAAVGLVTVATASSQQARLAGTTVELQATTEALLRLENELLESAGPMFDMLYRYDPNGAERYERAAASYDKERVHVLDAWDHALAVTQGRDGHADLVRGREAWLEADAEVRAAATSYTTEDLLRFYLADHDPFEEAVWARIGEGVDASAAMRRSAVAELAASVEGAERINVTFFTSVVVLLLVAFALALLTTRRVTRRVVAPLAAISDNVHRLRDSATTFHVEVPEAVAEVQELARVLNETSVTLRAHHLALRDQALTDTVTSLPNRDGFTETLRDLLSDPTRERVSVLFIDLDDFKRINDTMGHSVGDQALRQIGARLATNMRPDDVAARIGGDEFAVALDTTTDPDAATRLAERILEAFDEPLDLAERQIRLGCSIGIATSDDARMSDDGPTDADVLLGHADVAMYVAKSDGKRRYQRYSPALHAEGPAPVELPDGEISHGSDLVQYPPQRTP